MKESAVEKSEIVAARSKTELMARLTMIQGDGIVNSDV